MIGIIYKDFCIIKKTLFSNLLVILFMSAWCFIPWIKEMDGTESARNIAYGMAFFLVPLISHIMSTIIMGSMGTDIIIHDENKYYSAFISSTPLTGRGQVLCKYYEILLLLFFIVVWGYVLDIIISLVNGISGSSMIIYVTLFFFSVFLKSVETPFLIRYGVSSGKVVKIIVMVSIVYIFLIYLLFGPLPDLSSDSIFDYIINWFIQEKNLSYFTTGVVAVLPYLVMIMFYLSYKVSCRWYQEGVNAYDS